jgi:hypothetical protein
MSRLTVAVVVVCVLLSLTNANTAELETEIGSITDRSGNVIQFFELSGQRVVRIIVLDRYGARGTLYSYDFEMWSKFVSMFAEALASAKSLKPGQRMSFDPMYGFSMSAEYDKKWKTWQVGIFSMRPRVLLLLDKEGCTKLQSMIELVAKRIFN